jgi:hypothetical protein
MVRKEAPEMMTSVYVADKSFDELERLFSCQIDDDDFYTVIAYNMALKSPTHFTKRIREYEESRLRGALFALGFAQDAEDEVAAVLIAYLEYDDELNIAEAIDALRSQRRRECEGKIARMDKHQSPYVRSAVLRYLRFVRGKASYATLLGALKEQHHIVRQSAVDELADLGDTNAMPHIQPLMADSHPDVRLAAESALKDLAP